MKTTTTATTTATTIRIRVLCILLLLVLTGCTQLDEARDRLCPTAKTILERAVSILSSAQQFETAVSEVIEKLCGEDACETVDGFMNSPEDCETVEEFTASVDRCQNLREQLVRAREYLDRASQAITLAEQGVDLVCTQGLRSALGTELGDILDNLEDEIAADWKRLGTLER